MLPRVIIEAFSGERQREAIGGGTLSGSEHGEEEEECITNVYPNHGQVVKWRDNLRRKQYARETLTLFEEELSEGVSKVAGHDWQPLPRPRRLRGLAR